MWHFQKVGVPRVKYALKAYLVSISKIHSPEDIKRAMTELTGKQNTRITSKTVNILNSQDVPMGRVITLKDLKKIENRLKCAIVLYALHKKNPSLTD